MIEKIVLDFLNNILDVPVCMEKQNVKKYVLIEKTGSGCVDYINTATFAIQSYGASLYEAASLNESVKEAMNKIIELDEISSVSLNTDYNYTDTETKKYRYQAIYDLVY